MNLTKKQEILNGLASILFEINFEYKTWTNNLFIKVHKESDNSRILDEVLIRLLNEINDIPKQTKIIKCLYDLMNNYENCIFYSNDLEVLIDILLPKLEMADNFELKLKLLKCVEKITRYKEYHNMMYKVDEIIDLIVDFERDEKRSEDIKKIDKQILSNIDNK